MDEVWTFEHSIECPVSVDFAWSYWTNTANWALDADVESVELHGPFAAGVSGVTHSRSSGRIEWRIASCEPGTAVIEFPAPGALGRFIWTFQDAGGKTLIRQHVSLGGEQAQAIADAMGPALQAGIPAGMQRLCEAMEAA
ncbi:MAG: SRPBCC family protein [Bryobacteraceae bacterium]